MANSPVVSMPASPQLGSVKKQFLTEAELSEMIAVPRSTLRGWRFIGLGVAYTKFGRSVRYPITAVQEYIRSNMVVPALAALEDKHAA
jgi:hypothetical protein